MGMPSVLVQRPQPVVQVIAAILSTAGALMLLESALLRAARWTPAALTAVTDRQIRGWECWCTMVFVMELSKSVALVQES